MTTGAGRRLSTVWPEPSLRLKLTSTLVLVVVALGATISLVTLNRQEDLIETNLRNELSASGRLLQAGTTDSFFNDDIAAIRSLLSAAFAHDNILRVWAVDPDGLILTDGTRSNRFRHDPLDLSGLDVSAMSETMFDGNGTLTGMWPVEIGDLRLGSVVVEMSTAKADTAISAERRTAAVVFIGFLAFGVFIVGLIASRVADRLHVLTQAASRIANVDLYRLMNELDTTTRDRDLVRFELIDVDSRDEVGVLGNAFNTMLEAISDLSQRLIALLDTSQQRFAVGFEQSPIGAVELDASGIILSANGAMADLLGYDIENLIGRSVAELVIGEPTGVRHSISSRTDSNPDDRLHREEQAQVAYRHATGHSIWVKESITVIPDVAERHHFLLQAVDITEERIARDALQHQALHDGLTGLPNRALVEARLRRALARAKDNGTYVAVMFIDIDNFKVVNDNLGHTAGDQLLIDVAQRMTSSSRASDTVARFGGDEFVIICEDLASPEMAFRRADQLRADLTTLHQSDQSTPTISASVGVTASDGNNDPEALLRDADLAMYQAKERGRDRVVIFRTAMRESLVARLKLESELAHAIEADELILHYQPLLDVGSGGIVSFEALVRWQHPTRGLLAPGQFLPIANQLGMLSAIDTWVLRSAVAQLAHWRKGTKQALAWAISVNASPASFTDATYTQVVEEALKSVGLGPSDLTIELTEESILTNIEIATRVVSDLKRRGIKVAIDDFGTGYSSLAQLDTFDFDVIKIDRSFAPKLDTTSGAALTKTIIEMAHALELITVAEGVETSDHLLQLQELGVDLAQGYLISRPLPAPEALALALEWDHQMTGSTPPL